MPLTAKSGCPTMRPDHTRCRVAHSDRNVSQAPSAGISSAVTAGADPARSGAFADVLQGPAAEADSRLMVQHRREEGLPYGRGPEDWGGTCRVPGQLGVIPKPVG